MFDKRHLRSGFRILAATAVVVGAVMNLATPSVEHASKVSVTAPF